MCLSLSISYLLVQTIISLYLFMLKNCQNVDRLRSLGFNQSFFFIMFQRPTKMFGAAISSAGFAEIAISTVGSMNDGEFLVLGISFDLGLLYFFMKCIQIGVFICHINTLKVKQLQNWSTIWLLIFIIYLFFFFKLSFFILLNCILVTLDLFPLQYFRQWGKSTLILHFFHTENFVEFFVTITESSLHTNIRFFYLKRRNIYNLFLIDSETLI